MTKWHILCSTGIGRECGLDKGMECIIGFWWLDDDELLLLLLR